MTLIAFIIVILVFCVLYAVLDNGIVFPTAVPHLAWEEQRLQRWERRRQKGIWRFAFFNSATFGMLFFVIAEFVAKLPLPWYALLITCLLGGFLWGGAMWSFSMWLYRRRKALVSSEIAQREKIHKNWLQPLGVILGLLLLVILQKCVLE